MRRTHAEPVSRAYCPTLRSDVLLSRHRMRNRRPESICSGRFIFFVRRARNSARPSAMSTASSTGGDRVQLLVLVDSTDASARYCVLSIDPTQFTTIALASRRGGSGCTGHRQIDLIGGAGAEHEALATWLDQKQRRGEAVLTAA